MARRKRRSDRIVYYTKTVNGKTVRVRTRRGLFFIVRRHIRALRLRFRMVAVIRGIATRIRNTVRHGGGVLRLVKKYIGRVQSGAVNSVHRRISGIKTFRKWKERNRNMTRTEKTRVSSRLNSKEKHHHTVGSQHDDTSDQNTIPTRRDEDIPDATSKHQTDTDSPVLTKKKTSSSRRWYAATLQWTGRIIRAFFGALLDFAILVVIALIIIFLYVWFTIPSPEEMRDTRRLAQTTILYDSTGETVLYEIHGEENRKRVSHDDIPDNVRNATIAAEDDAFYTHIGIDPFSIARAIKENLLRGTLAQGGSTITQQLARNVFFTREKTLQRKVREAVMAIKIERAFTKEEILDMYLNVIPYGANAYGIEAAAEVYFGKRASEVTLDEAALLAALPKAPTTFSPYGTHTNRLVARQKMILERMRELGLAHSDEIDAALEADTLQRIVPLRTPIRAPHMVFAVVEELEQRYGRTMVQRGGLRVYTTLDMTLQQAAEDVLTQYTPHILRHGGSNAALVSIDPRTGAVLAMLGSRDFDSTEIDGQVNVLLRLRQPGSAFKPFAYAAAFERGYQPETVVWDVLTDFGPDGSGRRYMPRNYTGRFYGLVSLRHALAQSLNVPAVKVLYLAGIDRTIDLAERMGISTLTQRSRYGLALVLGGAEVKGVELAGAYGAFAQDGMFAAPHMINRITDADGTVLYDASREITPHRVLSEQTARKINSILSDNTARARAFGRNSALNLPGTAAKTGTTQLYRDAWTVGYTPTLVTAVWVGNNNNRPLRPGASGGVVAAPIWRAFMQRSGHVPPPEAAREVFASYDVVRTSIPMLNGRVMTMPVVEGARVKKKKKKKKKSAPAPHIVFHTILHYVDISSPLTTRVPSRRDPMYPLWEASLARSMSSGK